jgi:GTP pyrophosphokinase
MTTIELLKPLVDGLTQSHPGFSNKDLERAFIAADKAHTGQLRKSGEAYITHPVAVAQILIDLGMDLPTVMAALLHDTVEDTTYSIEQIKSEFGDEVTSLVDGVTKLDKLTYGPTAEAETLRKMVVAMSRDIRVLVIKLADRLHNARTWDFIAPETAQRKAKETIDIYAPLAHRLGMNAIKWELEDLSFKILEPKKFEEIERLVGERSPARDQLTSEVVTAIDADLKIEGISAQVIGRQKHFYSVYQKMVVRGREFNDIYDLVGIRILVDSVRDCYGVLGSIHARWSPVPGRFKDYIAMPKFNLYQSLHTTVIGPNGKAVEIQIRTFDMHARAEYGIAAHWKYKSKNTESGKSPEVLWLRQLHEWQQESEDVGDFLETLRYDLRTPEVFVFTPKGSVIALPSGSTPVDFAYAVHTEIGHRTMGAKVNGRLVPLETTLQSGDVVEILTSKSQDASPSQDWIQFVASQRAKSKIKAWFTAERKDDSIERGKDLLAKALRKQNVPIQRALAADSLLKITSDLRYAEAADLYAAIGDNHLSAQSVVEKMAAALSADEDSEEAVFELPTHTAAINRTRNSDSGVLVRGDADVMVKLARCCTPVPGDEILGFITRATGVSVHRSDCKNADDLRSQPERLIDVSWLPNSKSQFLVQIQIEALDRGGLLSDVTRVLSEHHVNILSASVSTRADRVALSRFVFEMSNPSALEGLLNSVRQIDNVYDVYRVKNG